MMLGKVPLWEKKNINFITIAKKLFRSKKYEESQKIESFNTI
jgi:hypothetical protein